MVLKTLLLVLCLAVLAFGNQGATLQEASASQQVSPEHEEFTVTMPQLPRVSVGKRLFGVREGEVKFRFYVATAGNALFLVESYETGRPKDVLKILLTGRRAVSSTAQIELDGFKGKEFEHHVEGLAFKGRYFATRNHVYIVQTAKRGAYDPVMDQFLNSFRLGNINAKTSLEANVPPDSADEIVDIKRVPTKAIILSKLPASYTDAARARRINGTIVLRCVLRATGEVTDIEVQRGLSDGLDEQSIAATKSIVFVPAMKDGKPVSQRVIVEYNFNIY